MSTTIDLTDQEAQVLRELTQMQDVAEAARVAIQEFVRYRKRMNLIALFDQVEMDDSWRELEHHTGDAT